MLEQSPVGEKVEFAVKFLGNKLIKEYLLPKRGKL